MKLKKAIYILLTIILGIMLSYIVHGAIEIIILQTSDEIIWYYHLGFISDALPPVIAYGLIALGIIGGYLLGKFWWQRVYVEGQHWWFYWWIHGKKRDDQDLNEK